MNAHEAAVGLLIVFVVAAWLYVSPRIWDTKPCPRCGGSGKKAGSDSSRWGLCGRCDGKGEVRRWGAGRG